VNYVILRIISTPILTPLPDVAVHVVKPKLVSWETAYRNRFLSIIALLPVAVSDRASVIGLVGENRSTKMKRGCRSRTATIFPLGFAGQTIRFLVFVSQFLDELLAISPRNPFHRQ